MSWRNDIEQVMVVLGRPATSSEIYEAVIERRRHQNMPIPKHARHHIRRILLDHYRQIGDGRQVSWVRGDT